MKIYLILAMFCVFAACNISDDGPTQTRDEICETCSNEEVCFEEECCDPATECTADQCGEVSDGCGKTINCGECCTPATECAEDQCGEVSDGCGNTINCGECGCFNDNFADFCPSRPCETATACNDDRECVYEAVTCGGSACECDDPTSCADVDLRDCRDQSALVCPADFCDPSPTMENGAMVFQNTCVQPEAASCDFSNLCAGGICAGTACVEAECGLCNLGAWSCAPMTTDATCYDIPSPLVDMTAINCNGNSPDSSFIYVDHIDGTDAGGSGTRAQPFLSLDAAITAAKLRGANGVVIRSGLTQNTTLTIENGISLYGGFSGAPDWKYDGGTFNVDVATPNVLGNVIAVLAHDITDRTVLYRVNIRSGAASAQKSSSYGLHALNANALVLQEVTVVAGKGSDGTIGSAGSGGNNGKNATNGATNRAPGTGGLNAICPLVNGSRGGIGARDDRSGTNGETTVRGVLGGKGGGAGQGGRPGLSFDLAVASGSAGIGGLNSHTLITNFYLPGGDGGVGTTGEDGAGGSGGGGAGGFDFGFGGNIAGGGGGGGGSGGCGGEPGGAGLAGGGSFGIFALSSTGIEIIGSSVGSGNAGIGGRGGVGGVGGKAGNRGLGGFAQSPGGQGGVGRPGGIGGPGGGGAGGDTYAIFCENTIITPTETTLEFGTEGLGGDSLGNKGENGKAGESFSCE